MSTNRELLELAAKAAGMNVLPFDKQWPRGATGWFQTKRAGDVALYSTDTPKTWNPLTDDGDALRLAVKLNIDIRFDTLPDGPYVEAVASWSDTIHCDAQDLGKDAGLATRRCIVRTAAEIGRAQ